jgi:rRNA biogenesis protein RRP5
MALEVQVVTGRVKKVATFGVFVTLADSLLHGLVHISELSDSFTRDPESLFTAGQVVRAVVLKKDEVKQHISLGMKPSYFTEGTSDMDVGADNIGVTDGNEHQGGERIGGEGGLEDMDLEEAMAAAFDEESESSDVGSEGSGGEENENQDEDCADELIRHARASKGMGAGGDDDNDSDVGIEGLAVAVSSSEGEEGNDQEGPESEPKGGSSAFHSGSGAAEEVEGVQRPASNPTNRTLSAAAASEGWDALSLDAAASIEQVDATPTAEPLSKRAKRKARDDKAAEVRKAELDRLDKAAPRNTEDFERLVLGSPSSSYVWIRYMAFLLGMAEVGRARAVAERALVTIDYRYVAQPSTCRCCVYFLASIRGHALCVLRCLWVCDSIDRVQTAARSPQKPKSQATTKSQTTGIQGTR